MFENDEWNIDEDYLNDFNSDKVIKGFQSERKERTQAQNPEVKEKSSINTSRFEFNCSAFENSKDDIGSQCANPTSRKDAILDIFKITNNPQKELKFSVNNTFVQHPLIIQNSGQLLISKHNVANECRKNLVLDVFQDDENTVIKSNSSKSKPTVKSVLKIVEATSENESENKLKRKKNVAFSESVNETHSDKKICVSTANLSVEKSKDSNFVQNNESLFNSFRETTLTNKSYINDSKKHMLLDLLKSPIPKNARALRTRAPQTVIRKFPGPAGLLPDDVDESEVIYLDSLDENKNNKYAEVCSQNTKNLFTTGAWQLMMDDLPADFQIYDIAAVKENALEYSRAYKKVPYLAGIVQYIDYKPNDPHVVLKDLSGKIDARIHHSICKLHPNALGTGIVILVKDVGLIVTSKKYVCLIISLKNLVSLYSDDARLAETSHLQKLLDKNYNCNFHESQISILDTTHENNQKHNTKVSSERTNKHKSESELMSKYQSINTHNTESITTGIGVKPSNSKQQSKVIDSIDNVHDFDFSEDDSWLEVNFDDLKSLKADQFPSSTPMDMNIENSRNKSEHERQNKFILKTEEYNDWQKKAKSTLKNVNSSLKDSIIKSDETLKVFFFNKDMSPKVIMSTTNNRLLNLTTNYNSIKSKCSSNSERINKSISVDKNNEETCTSLSNNTEQTSSSNSLFKPPSSNEGNIKNKSTITDTKLFDSNENDTDDEMLSQLDVDAIAARYE